MSKNETTKLLEIIGPYRAGSQDTRKAFDQKDRVPVSYRWLRQRLKDKHGLTAHSAWTRHRIQLRPGNRKDSIGRRVLLKIAEKLHDDELLQMADPRISWVEVRSIKKLGMVDMYDLTVDGDESFVADGLVAHNSRGIPADLLLLDEIQDILKDNVKVIAECLSFSDYGWEFYSGTPKTMDNTIEEYWKWSNQMEWAVPCSCNSGHGSGTYYNILGIDNIGKEGPICDKCGKRINPELGQWVVTNPGEQFVGFHVTQLMVPWKLDVETWKKEIVGKYERWPDARFHNEVLGESFDQASKPITMTEIQQCCHPINTQNAIDNSRFHMEPTEAFRRMENWAGVDWGEGRSEGSVEQGKKRHASFTVLTIGTFINNDLFWPFFMKRYEGKEIDPEFIKVDIVRQCARFNVRCIGADYGHGWGMNSHLISYMGRDRVMELQYVARQRERIKWDKLGFKFQVNRSLAVAEFLDCLKKQDMLLPPWAMAQPFAKDILSIYIDYNEKMKTMYYDHPIDQPDDAMHSMIYARLAGMISRGIF